MQRLVNCINRGLNAVAADLLTVRGHAQDVPSIQDTLEPTFGLCIVPRPKFDELTDRPRTSDDLLSHTVGKV